MQETTDPEDKLPSVQQTEAGFGERVRDARLQKKLSQKQLAEKLSLDASAISRLEQGTRAIRLGEAALIAQALDADLDELVYGEQDPRVRLRQSRRWADEAMNQVRTCAVDMLENYMEIVELLGENPDLFQNLEDRELDPPQTVDEYLEWVAQRTRRLFRSPEPGEFIVVDSPTRANQLRALASATIENLVQHFPANEQEEISKKRHPSRSRRRTDADESES